MRQVGGTDMRRLLHVRKLVKLYKCTSIWITPPYIKIVPHIMLPTWNRFVVVKEEIKTMAPTMAPVILDPDPVN